MQVQKQMRICDGEAIFTSARDSLWDMRQSAKQALLRGDSLQAFVVTKEEMHCPHALDQILSQRRRLEEIALMLGENIVGAADGRLRCAALWDIGSWDGVLLHREGRTLFCAYIPIVSQQKAFDEHVISMRLAALAEEAKEMQVFLDYGIPAGRWSLHELLHSLSEQIEV